MKLFAVCVGSLLLVGSVFGAKNRPADVGSDTGSTKKASRRRRTSSSAERQRRDLAQMHDSDILEPQNPERIGRNVYQRQYMAVSYEGQSKFYGGVVVDTSLRSDTTPPSRINSIGVPYAGKPNTGINLLGTATTTMSNIFMHDSIFLEAKPGFDYLNIDHPSRATPASPFQPRDFTLLPPNEDFFMQNTCKVTKSGKNGDTLDRDANLKWTTLAHSCTYDVCLGGGGYNCINIYAGQPYLFARPVYQGPSSNTPPTFQGFILGGTGAFYRIRGYAQFTIEAGPLPMGTPPAGLIDGKMGSTVYTVILFTNQELPPGPGALNIQN